MRNWFAAFSPAKVESGVTRVTRVTRYQTPRKSGVSTGPRAQTRGGNMRVTRVTQRMDGYPQADGFVTPVTPLSPDPILPEISSEPAENVDFEPIVTPVTDVTPANGTPVWSKTDWQAFFDERAGRLEYDHGLPRQAAERRAFDFAVVEWLNQHLEPSDPGHCAWCNGADTSGACVVPYGTNPVGPTWLHSQCWDAWYQERHRNAVSALKGLGITE